MNSPLPPSMLNFKGEIWDFEELTTKVLNEFSGNEPPTEKPTCNCAEGKRGSGTTCNLLIRMETEGEEASFPTWDAKGDLDLLR